MTAAESGAAEPRERRKRTVALVALSACVALLAYAAARKAPTLRTAPEAVPSLPPGECSCNAAGIAPNPPFVSDGLQELTGTVEDCCCDFETVDRLNEEVLYPLLTQLTELPFFRYFKVNLYCDCPFWPDDGMCALPDCSVCECPADEVPLPWRTQAPEAAAAGVPVVVAPTSDGADCASGASGEGAEAMVNAREGVVNRTLDVGAEFRAWRELDNPWTADDEAGSDAAYVNLALNPERYTGYTGDHAHRVWNAIYSQPCFAEVANGTCGARPEVRMFYRLISGTHASITAHIAAEYLVDSNRGVWGRNHALWLERLGVHRDWQENLYFTALFVLRALLKAGDFLLAADYRTGSPSHDALTATLVRKLVESPVLRSACPVPFDEARLWHGQGGEAALEELRANFRNVSAVLDCVGCEKCRLWGKLQFLGLGTALKILFSLDPGSACPELQRNEVIALVNLLHRLSESLKVNREFAAAQRSGATLDTSAMFLAEQASGLPSFLI